MSQSEIGRELSIVDLQAMTLPKVVCVCPPGQTTTNIIMATFWLMAIDAKTAIFFGGDHEPPLNVLNFIRDGKLVDDQDRVVRVFEYLGEVA